MPKARPVPKRHSHKGKRSDEQRERVEWPCECGATNRLRDKRCPNCGRHKP